MEIKIDNTSRFNATPIAQLEHVWFTFPVIDEILSFRVGLEENVFSRNALTSDSKLLFMDRRLIMGALVVLRVTDNTVGALVYGRPFDGRLTYSAGVFDNLGFETSGRVVVDPILTRQPQGAMTVGRIVYDFLDPANPRGSYDDYQSSYIGRGKRLTICTNLAYVSKAQIGDDIFSLTAWGADFFFNHGLISLEGEYNAYIENFSDNGKACLDGEGWYAQVGYLILSKIEVAFRYQELDINNQVFDDKLRLTSFGVNYYIKKSYLQGSSRIYD